MSRRGLRVMFKLPSWRVAVARARGSVVFSLGGSGAQGGGDAVAGGDGTPDADATPASEASEGSPRWPHSSSSN